LVIVEILHRVEGGDVEQWLELQNIFLCLRLPTISLDSLSLFTSTYIAYSFARSI